jgi:hypothetical protein
MEVACAPEGLGRPRADGPSPTSTVLCQADCVFWSHDAGSPSFTRLKSSPALPRRRPFVSSYGPSFCCQGGPSDPSSSLAGWTAAYLVDSLYTGGGARTHSFSSSTLLVYIKTSPGHLIPSLLSTHPRLSFSIFIPRPLSLSWCSLPFRPPLLPTGCIVHPQHLYGPRNHEAQHRHGGRYHRQRDSTCCFYLLACQTTCDTTCCSSPLFEHMAERRE